MSYHKTGIQKLSANQIRRLLKGDRVIVKHGDHHHIHASAEQVKKIARAHQKGKGVGIQFDPYQIEHHKSTGIFDSIKSAARSAVSQVVPHAINHGARLAHGAVSAASRYADKKAPSFASHALRGVAGHAHRLVNKAESQALAKATNAIEHAFGREESHASAAEEPETMTGDLFQGQGLRRRKKATKGGALMAAGYGLGKGNCPHHSSSKKCKGKKGFKGEGIWASVGDVLDHIL